MHGNTAVLTLILLSAIIPLIQYPVTVAGNSVVPITDDAGVNVNITTDENGTVYIQIGGVSIYNYTRTTLSLSWFNITHISVVYSGVYVHSPSELYIMRIKVFNGTVVNATPVYDLVFNATGFNTSSMLYMSRYLNVYGFTNVSYIIYIYDNGTWTEIYRGSMPPPPGNRFSGYYAMDYLSYLATLIPVAVLFGLAGRGNIRDIGIGLIVYGVFLMFLPFIGIYAPYMNALIVVSILGGIILLIFTK